MAGLLWLLSSSLVFLAYVLNSLTPQRIPPLVNYDRTVYFNHDNLYTPSSKEEIVHVVKLASENHRKIRVLGTGHSRSALAHSSDILLSLCRFTGVVSLDMEAKQVTVKAGTLLSELNDFLEEQGLAFSNLPAVAKQTIGGALSTGSHGTGVSHGNLATMVTRIELVSGKGELITTSPEHNPNLFKAAQVSIGMLGVITEVTLQCEDKFNLEETLIPYPLEYCIQNLDQITASADHAKLWIELHSGMCAAFLVNRTVKDERDIPNLWLWNLKWRALEVPLWVVSWIPQLTEPVMTLIFGGHGRFFSAHNFVDISHRIFVPQHYFPSNNQAEYIVDREHSADAVRELTRVVKELSLAVNLVAEVRFVKSDDIWLSPNYDRDACHITLMIYNPTDTAKMFYFDEYYNVVKKYRARFHWGKYFRVAADEVRTLYPRLSDFMEIRAGLDPQGILMNDQLQKLFGL